VTPRALTIDRATRSLIIDRASPGSIQLERASARDIIIHRSGLPGPASPLPPILKGGFF
jgi:hypothetical protein